MIETDITNLDVVMFRYLMYLSMHNTWVNVGGELYKVDITHPPESTTNDPFLKLYFCKIADYVSTSNLVWKLLRGPIRADVLEPTQSLPRLTLVCHDSSDLTVNMATGPIQIKLHIESYDYHCVKTLNRADAADREQMLQGYAMQKKIMMEDAAKAAIWMAAKSGDNFQLTWLLDGAPRVGINSIDINSTFNGKNIIQAMLDADPENDIPYFSRTNYKETLNVLIARGFDFYKPVSPETSLSTLDLCKQYKSAQNNLWFFQRVNPVRATLLAEIESRFRNEMRDTDNDDLRNTCAMM